jgi:hypothetical protein
MAAVQVGAGLVGSDCCQRGCCSVDTDVTKYLGDWAVARARGAIAPQELLPGMLQVPGAAL